MLVSRHQNTVKYHDIKCVTVEIFGTIITNQNLIQEETKRRFSSGNACYNSVQNFCLLVCCRKNVKIRICKSPIFPVVLYGCESWSVTLREEHRDFGCLRRGF
jgi:hypothetical protein